VVLIVLRKNNIKPNALMIRNFWSTVSDFCLPVLQVDFSLNYKIQCHALAAPFSPFFFEELKRKRKREAVTKTTVVMLFVPNAMLKDFAMCIHFQIMMALKHTTFSKRKVAEAVAEAYCTNPLPS
jgi:hypothetical protein